MKGGSGGPRGAGTGGDDGSRTQRLLKSWEQDARETYEHKPQELCVSVNGYLLGSQRINSKLNELTLSVKEQISFFEVFSEQGIRLMMMDIDELPPDGPGEQVARIELSDDRTLESRLMFSSPWPTLHVVYHDPSLNEAPAEAPAEIDATKEREPIPSIPQPDSLEERSGDSPRDRLLLLMTRVWRLLSNWHLWLRPATVTAVFAVVLIAALLFVQTQRFTTPTVSAAELLRRSAAAEEAIAGRTDTVLQRTINLEERKDSGELIARHRVEVWHSAEKGITARRLYDEQNKLIAGDWRRADGVQTLYRRGSQPQLQLTPEKRDAPAIDFDQVWQLDPSAKDFTRLIRDDKGARVEERPDAYVIAYAGGASGNTAGLVRATLVLNRADLHPVEQTLLVREASEVRQYRFIESGFERRAPESVAPQVFEPELLGPAVSVVKPMETAKAEAKLAPGPRPPTPSVATAELEVEVLRLLHQAGADLGEQVNVTRTPGGQLRIEGIIETDARKAEILRALAPVGDNGTVIIDVATVAEALDRQAWRNSWETPAATGTPTVSEVATASDTFPAYADLRERFSEAEAKAFASRMVNRSDRAMRHAGALKQLAGRFSPEAFQALDAEAQSKLIALIRSHARAFQSEIAAPRRELQIAFPDSGSAATGSSDEINDTGELLRAAARLFELAAANDQVIRTAFTISPGSAATTAIKTPQFWRSLQLAESLAEEIQSARLDAKR